jgi:hypothetical protein
MANNFVGWGLLPTHFFEELAQKKLCLQKFLAV